jgi:hypothetical protein
MKNKQVKNNWNKNIFYYLYYMYIYNNKYYKWKNNVPKAFGSNM